ncbi:hypothetical protein HPB49_006249 [Dermacentor silvarum]|uniref:Uncharacterized protein n=1 Tax=Dermacentor silvarum TaxID=543639 RepID=A0ACB8DVT4_DERSI|nr:hypothetical protein HPB49_006249 [Dermacentor silvarum]
MAFASVGCRNIPGTEEKGNCGGAGGGLSVFSRCHTRALLSASTSSSSPSLSSSEAISRVGDGTRREAAGLILKDQLGTTGAENEVTVPEHRPSFPLGIAGPSSSSGATSKDQPSNISSSSDDGALQLLDPWDTDPSAVDLLLLRAEEQRNKSPTPAHAKPSGQCLLCPVPSLSSSLEVPLVPGIMRQPSLRDVCCPGPPPHQGNSGSTSVSSSVQLQPTPTPRGSNGSGGGRPSVPIPATRYQGLAFKQASAADKIICQNDPLPRSSISENTPAALLLLSRMREEPGFAALVLQRAAEDDDAALGEQRIIPQAEAKSDVVATGQVPAVVVG